ncbi:MAG: CoA transferase [Ectothiorhodospiraceae bacterium]|nr:CoA transferase [Chromatiales bacterium]MCP5153325.1 CoA transferase [Ectothiorhodospiraceae bacterium]
MPLRRFRVLDLTRARAGPTAAKQLADWGANVVKIEPPRGDDLSGPRDGPDFQNLHRNKRGLVLDLKDPRGVDALKRLAVGADVLIENYRPDVKHRLGIDYETMRAVNPRLVYASISGFGQDGPYARRPGVDQIAQGMGGLMSVTGPDGGGPLRVGIPIVDLTTGLYCALAISMALLHREVSGEGQWVQAALLQSQVALMDLQAMQWLMGGVVPRPVGNDHPTSIPTGTFETADGHINIGASGGDMFERLARAIDAPELPRDPRFATEADCRENRHALNAAINARLRTASSAHWVEVLNAAGVPCGPINDMRQVFEDPQVRHLGMAAPVEHPRLGTISLVGPAFRMSATPPGMRRPTPDLGEHSAEVLAEAGFSDEEIAALDAAGVTRPLGAAGQET